MARDFESTENDRIDWASAANLTANATTVSAWVKIEALQTNGYILCIHNSGDTAFGLVVNQTNATLAYVNFNIDGATDGVYTSDASYFSTGAWIHVLVTWDGTNGASACTLYKNGVSSTISRTATLATETTHTGSWSLGGRIYSTDRHFDGLIAEVGVWSSVLGSTTIAALADGDPPGWYATNQVFYYSAKTDTVVAEVGGTGTNAGSAYSADHPLMNQRVTLDAAALTATPVPLADVVIVTGATVILDAAALTATPVPAADVVSLVRRLLDTAALTSTPIPLVVVEQQYTVLDPAVLTATGIGVTLSLTTPVFITLKTTTLTATGIASAVIEQQYVMLDATALTAMPVKIADVNAPVTRILDPAVLTATGIAFTVIEDQYITLDTAALTATGIQNVIISNSLALMDTSVLTLTAIPFRFAVTITLETG